MILVTGAAGKTGQAIIRALRKRETAVRALVHKNSHVQHMRALGVQEVIAGDMRSDETMSRVLRGVSAIYHICPNVSPDEVTMGQTAIRAAQSAEIELFVYHSVLHPQIEAMPHHWQKMRVEEMLFASGLPFTILQPAPYMQNILAYWHEITRQREYIVPYSENARLSMVDLDDVADVAALILNEPGHNGATYELCGADTLSAREIAQVLSRFLGYEVNVAVDSVDAWEVRARSRGLGDYQVNALINMFNYYEQFGLIGNARILACLLHRPPTPYAEFVKRTIGEQE